MKAVRLLAAVLVVLLFAGTSPAKVRILSRHRPVEVGAESGRSLYLKLEPEQILRFSATGPVKIGLRMCELLGREQSVVPLDITVVKNRREQGTVRVDMPSGRPLPVAQLPQLVCSRTVLLAIGVPPGRHSYELIVSGSHRGVLVQLAGTPRRDERVFVATPEADRKRTASLPLRRKPKRRVRKLAVPEELVLDPLPPSAPPAAVTARTYVVRSNLRRFGPATRVAGATAAVLVGSSLALVFAGVADVQRARAEPVQIPAGAYWDRSRGSFKAAAVVGGLGVAAAVCAAVLYVWLEKPVAETSIVDF